MKSVIPPWQDGSLRDSYYMVSHGKLQKFKKSGADHKPSYKFEDKPKGLPEKKPLRGLGNQIYNVNNQ